MKFGTQLFYYAWVLTLGLASCSAPEKSATEGTAANDSSAVPTPSLKDSIRLDNPTETFRGTLMDKEIVFSHKDFQTFTFNEGGQAISGAMNTEKGYGDDRDATVYVLNSDKPKNEQKFIVRNTNGSVYLLDQERFVVEDAVFEPVKNKVAAPVVEKKPATKEKVAKKKTEKSVAAKKAPAKKAVKSKKKKKKKKKAVRKSRKKSSAKKPAAESPAQNPQ